MRVLLFSAGLCLVAGCGEAADSTAGRASAPTAEATASPDPAELPAPALSAYLGKYPFDAVDGVVFIDHPVVRQALESSGAPAEALWRETGIRSSRPSSALAPHWSPRAMTRAQAAA